MFSTCSIACTCSGRICWARFEAVRATPDLLPIGEGRIAVVLLSRNFCILPATLAVLHTAPLLLWCRPLRRPVSLAISAVVRIYWTSGRDCWCYKIWTINEAQMTTAQGFSLGPMVLVRLPLLPM